MKRFPLLLALALAPGLALAQAQPAVAPPTPAFKLSQPNQDALSLLGAFYDKVRRAKSYRGRVTLTKTILQEGKVLSEKTYEIQSSWVRDEKREDEVRKSLLQIVSTVVANNTTTEKFNSVDDGIKNYSFYQTQGAWSERNHDATDTPLPLALTRAAWINALAVFALGGEFKISRKVIDEQDQFIVDGTGIEYVFDTKSGDLQSFNVLSATEKSSFRWSQTEFDVSLPDSIFAWKAPEGAKQVAQGEAVFKFDF